MRTTFMSIRKVNEIHSTFQKKSKPNQVSHPVSAALALASFHHTLHLTTMVQEDAERDKGSGMSGEVQSELVMKDGLSKRR